MRRRPSLTGWCRTRGRRRSRPTRSRINSSSSPTRRKTDRIVRAAGCPPPGHINRVAMTDLAFPDHEYLTVKELADLLRLKERKIYDLAASGAVPCSRVTGKLLFPAADIREWIESAKSGGAPADATGQSARPPIVLGSHDPLLDWAIRQS